MKTKRYQSAEWIWSNWLVN